MVSTLIKMEICKEVLKKSGWDKNSDYIYSLVEAVRGDRFLFDLDNNEVISFVAWNNLQSIDGNKRVFIKNLWIDPKYRNKNYVIKIRTRLRNMFKDAKGIWLNIKKDKIIERI